MSATSIHIEPIKVGSEAHNTRAKSLDYVREDLSCLNKSYIVDSVDNRLKTIKENYTNTTGQQMQKKATPIREGVVVINEETSMQQLLDFAAQAENKFGITAFQIYIHKDEGHYDGEVWKGNLHAHIVFDWTQPNGKSCKLNKADMSELQSLLAKAVDMDRGSSSEIKHLNSVQFKIQQEEKRLSELQAQQPIEQLLEENRKLKNRITKLENEIKKVFANFPHWEKDKALSFLEKYPLLYKILQTLGFQEKKLMSSIADRKRISKTNTLTSITDRLKKNNREKDRVNNQHTNHLEM